MRTALKVYFFIYLYFYWKKRVFPNDQTHLQRNRVYFPSIYPIFAENGYFFRMFKSLTKVCSGVSSLSLSNHSPQDFHLEASNADIQSIPTHLCLQENCIAVNYQYGSAWSLGYTATRPLPWLSEWSFSHDTMVWCTQICDVMTSIHGDVMINIQDVCCHGQCPGCVMSWSTSRMCDVMVNIQDV